ncbi:hypothetical protein Athai_10250 [Actinocatenispora thailandica]|uniref:Peptidase S8/S53 domain-containing protein n=1 Tax=Actinocatenispora thailandica TaxID=227318 RepID=A0A7R7DKZ1_9ACTN|nr:S8 family serine peptidase [Actinocatenispora thailandica]BCJ33522.1 hypothetical protein Athai_10250 [Actinocatenispora thailandica]
MARRPLVGTVAIAAVLGLAAAGTPAAAAPTDHPPAGARRALTQRAPKRTGRPALGAAWTAPKATPRTVVPNQVLVVLADGTRATGARIRGRELRPDTSNGTLDATLRRVHAASLRPVATGAADPTLARTVLVTLAHDDSTAAARQLAGSPGVALAEPNRYVSAMHTAPATMPRWAGKAAKAPATTAAGVPANYGLTSSLQSYLNAGGVDATGAFAALHARGQLPGAGTRITNVSIGDLTDASMTDGYAAQHGATTVLRDGKRYLDLPAMPLIPTYAVGPDGTADPAGAVENEDPTLDEALLDFGVMAPLPHDAQRPGRTGTGVTDLLGIAPGARYRLVVPTTPTIDQVVTALLAAARQSPRPDVITASLGFGTDSAGFAGRYLEDDPVARAALAEIVDRYHVVVCVSSNDGVRVGLSPAAVGPDGGSTPTDLTRDPRTQTDIDDDAESTTPTRVVDSGVIAAGATTTDDVLSARPGDRAASARTGVTAATRVSGSGDYSSGFGTRIDLSAPGDAIPSFVHDDGGDAQAISVVDNGGTSASAPEIAAAAAVVLQSARLAHRHLTPRQVRSLLVRTGRPVPTPAQLDTDVHVGPQLDVTAAVESVLGAATRRPSIVRLSVAQRATLGNLGGAYTEVADPDRIDLAGPDGTGEHLAGTITIGADVVGRPRGRLDYVLTVGHTRFRSGSPAIRLTPAELLRAAGLPVVADADRSVSVRYDVLRGRHVLASTTHTFTVGATDGGYAEATAPHAPASVPAGRSVRVGYDLTGVRRVDTPTLVVSHAGRWNPVLAPIFTAAWSLPLTATKGTVTVPAGAFGDGGGLYGIGIVQNDAVPSRPVYGEFTPIRVAGSTAAQRPAAPLLAGSGGQPGHWAGVPSSAPTLSVSYDVRRVRRATGAVLEISAPGPTLYRLRNTFSNPNGTRRDRNGVDTGSVVYQDLGATHGTVRLDTGKLGLDSAVSYTVRVAARGSTGVLGQFSPVSTVDTIEGVAPDQGQILSFGMAGDDSVVSTTGAHGAALLPYRPDTGAYGAALATDTSGGFYEVIGADADAHRALALHVTAHDTRLETYDPVAGTRVAAVPVPDGYSVLGGRVDRVRHRAALLARHEADQADTVLVVDLHTGALGDPVPADPDGVSGWYSMIDVDASTGAVLLAHSQASYICFGFGTADDVARVDLDRGTVTGATGDPCGYAFAADQRGGSAYLLSYHSFSLNITGTSSLVGVDESSLAAGTATAVRREIGTTMAVDGAHHLALVVFPQPAGTPTYGSPYPKVDDVNGTGEIDVVDTTTGNTVRTITGVIAGTGYGTAYDPVTEQRIQLDPATRTAYLFAPDLDQIQRIRY